MLNQSVHHFQGGFPDLGRKHPKAGYRYHVGGRRFNLGHLKGRIFIHDGDDSAFEAKREGGAAKRERRR